jgi:uncharacterized membrane protein YhhN
MKKQYWILIYFTALATYIVAMEMGNELLQILSKPLLMLILIGYFLSSTIGIISDLRKWIVLALTFSMIGDSFLLLQNSRPVFFLLGLSAFLIAHLFYIIFFHTVRTKEKIRTNFLPVIIVAVYYGALIFWLSPYLGDMKLAVRIYGLVICFMFMLAMQMTLLRNKKAGQLMMIGALLFLLSDSTIAINKFYNSFIHAGLVIMLTYGIGQFLIVSGSINYLTGLRSK